MLPGMKSGNVAQTLEPLLSTWSVDETSRRPTDTLSGNQTYQVKHVKPWPNPNFKPSNQQKMQRFQPQNQKTVKWCQAFQANNISAISWFVIWNSMDYDHPQFMLGSIPCNNQPIAVTVPNMLIMTIQYNHQPIGESIEYSLSNQY